jgi:CRP/FNR family transcriptional regulator, cyclic AMP receptor protein
MILTHLLRNVELFDGLTDDELDAVAAICYEKQFKRGDIIAKQGEPGDEFFIVTQGFVEVILEEPRRAVVNLGPGQLIGEMAVVDQGPRSATVQAVDEPTIVQVISRDKFEALCKKHTRIGYIVIRNIAADLSFKLRHRNLSEK